MAEENTRSSMSKQKERRMISQTPTNQLKVPKTANKFNFNNTLFGNDKGGINNGSNNYNLHKTVHKVFVNGWNECIKSNIIKSHETYYRVLGHMDAIK